MTARAGLAFLLPLLLGLPGSAWAQSPVTPDRPGIVTDTQTVRPGAWQLEGGLVYGQTSVAASPTERRLGLEGTLRIGLTERLEVRLDGQPVVYLRDEREHVGAGDLALAVKYRWLDSAEGKWWPTLGLQPFVKLPSAPEPIGSGRTDFGALAIAELDLPWSLVLDGNAGLAAVGQRRPEGFLLQALAGAALSRPIVETLTAFAELFFATRSERGGGDVLGFQAGLTHFVTPRLALDMAVQTTLVGRGPDWAVRAGLSVRFGR